jgi:hypothetical protein
MTPFELHLSNELDVERQRFGNEWLFKWYSLNMEGRTVDVPSFDGGRITIGGVTFEGSAQSIFWQALGRYLDGKVHEIFQRWDRETSAYPKALRVSSLEGVGRLLNQFTAALMLRANETDQALRGRGTPKPDKSLLGSGTHAGVNVEVVRLLAAHKALIEQSWAKQDVSAAKSVSKWLEEFYANNKGLIWVAGIVGPLALAAIGALLKGAIG